MRLLIFILALTSAFFSSADDSSLPYDPNDLRAPDSQPFYYFECQGDNNNMEIASEFNDIKVCQPFWTTYIERAIDVYISAGSYSSVGPIVWTSSNRWSYEYTPCRYGDCGTFGTDTPRTASGQSPGSYLRTEWQHTCPPEQYPEYQFPVMKDPQPTEPEAAPMQCAKLLDGEPEPEPDPDADPDCPAPTDNDPFVFGTGQQQTICFNNPDGSQCSIETDENGNFYMPVSYGSQEPVACTEVEPTDPDPTDPDPTDPDPTDPDTTDPDPTDPDPTDPDKTPEPDPMPDPDPTDGSDSTELLPAMNKVNRNLDAINSNMNNGFESNNDRLDRIAKEIQTSNKLANEHVYESKAIKDAIIGANEITLGILQDMKNGVDSIGTAIGKTNSLITEGNEKLDKISDGINSTFEEGTCIGDLCTLDLSKELDDFDKSFGDFVNDEKDQKVPREFEAYLNRLDSYVSSAFSGFTGQCIPLDIRVCSRNVEHAISVGEHCPYYEDYFKPVIEWFLYVMTFVSVLNITSQSFRAFSTV